jgi:hypothetical protein
VAAVVRLRQNESEAGVAAGAQPAPWTAAAVQEAAPCLQPAAEGTQAAAVAALCAAAAAKSRQVVAEDIWAAEVMGAGGPKVAALAEKYLQALQTREASGRPPR